MNDSNVVEKLYQRASNLVGTSGGRFEGASMKEAMDELVMIAGGDVETLQKAVEHCQEAYEASERNDEIRRACELLAATADEAAE